MPDFLVREIDPHAEPELAFVADGMRRTLLEVEGEAGGTLYTPEWLRDRVQFHLDPARSTGAVFVAQGEDGALLGYTIVRAEADEHAPRHGLFSTTWVEPAARRGGVASELLSRGEDWMRAHGLPEAATWTSATNDRLIQLHSRMGYAQTHQGPNDLTGTPMVRLARRLAGAEPAAGKSFGQRGAEFAGSVLAMLIAGGVVCGLCWWLFLHPHGPHFWWWMLAAFFLGPIVAWVGFWVILYREHVFKWLLGRGQ